MNPEEENQLVGGVAEEATPEEVASEDTALDEALEEAEAIAIREGRPSFTSSVAEKAGAAAERTGTAARRLLAGLGSKLASPAASPPSILPKDDLSDLFEGPDMSRDNDVYIDDLITVKEEDVFGGPADMSDILEVTEEDVMGKEDYLGTRGDRPATSQVRKPFVRVVAPTEVRGLR